MKGKDSHRFRHWAQSAAVFPGVGVLHLCVSAAAQVVCRQPVGDRLAGADNVVNAGRSER